mgnify:CR=1 FL=1
MSHAKKQNRSIEPTPALNAIPARPGAIPNIDLSNIYDKKFAREDIQYGSLGVLADLLGRNPVPHRHDDFLQIHFIEAGTFDLRIDDQYWHAKGPALFLTPPAVPHAFTLSVNAKGHVLTLRQNFVWRVLEGDRSLPSRGRLTPFCANLSKAGGSAQVQAMSALFRMLQREMSVSQMGNDTVCNSIAAALLASALRCSDAGAQFAQGISSDFAHYRRFLGLVEEHFRSHWPVRKFAYEIGLTPWRLHDVVTTCSGHPPKAVLNERLLQEAKRQLAFSSAGIKEISSRLGFADTPYFCRFFKRSCGHTPTAYREIMQQGFAQKSATDSNGRALFFQTR